MVHVLLKLGETLAPWPFFWSSSFGLYFSDPPGSLQASCPYSVVLKNLTEGSWRVLVSILFGAKASRLDEPPVRDGLLGMGSVSEFGQLEPVI